MLYEVITVFRQGMEVSQFARLMSSMNDRISQRALAIVGAGVITSYSIHYTKLYELFETTEEHTRAVLFAHRELKEMDKSDRIRACYLHACLRYRNNFV